jgi:predicted DsbA family dithiol-disulfide isomerase
MQIDLFHDTVCPWCRIGKRHLELALDNWTGESPTVRIRSFFLNPDIPTEGYDFKPYMLAKGRGQMSLEDFFSGPQRMGQSAGLNFNFEAIEKAPNSLLSHRLIALTPETHKFPMVDAIYAAYFEHGRDIGDIDVLADIAMETGFDRSDIRAKLSTDLGEAEVFEDVSFARQAGISGVPFFIFNNHYAFSGAQPPEMIRRVMLQVTGDSDA